MAVSYRRRPEGPRPIWMHPPKPQDWEPEPPLAELVDTLTSIGWNHNLALLHAWDISCQENQNREDISHLMVEIPG